MTLNIVTLPKNAIYFNPNNLENFSSSNENTPTILGNGDGNIILYDNPNDNINEIEFVMPNQINIKNFVPLPMANLGIGIGKKTEFNIRYLPDIDFDIGNLNSSSINLWGIGVKHDLLQWIPSIGDAIPMSLSLQAAHTNLSSHFGFLHPSNNINQEVELEVNATTLNIVASKKILFVTAHAGLGYNSSNIIFNSNTSITLGKEQETITLKVPLDLKFNSENEFRTNIGIRLNLAIITLQFNHTFSKYPVSTIGLGLSIR